MSFAIDARGLVVLISHIAISNTHGSGRGLIWNFNAIRN